MSDPTYDLSNGTTVTNTNLAQNAYLIGEAIYARTLNTSAWDAMIPKSALPTGVGEALTSLMYDVSLPTMTANGSDVGATWTQVASSLLGSNNHNTLTDEQVNAGAGVGVIGTATGMSYVKFNKILRDYYLKTAKIQSPWFSVQDFRTAANIKKQWAAMLKALTNVTKWTWERRHQEEYERVCGRLIACKTSSTLLSSTVHDKSDNAVSFTGYNLTDLDLDSTGDALIPNAYISNKITDMAYDFLQLMSPADEAYGSVDGAPIWCLVLSGDASYALKKESGIADDVRQSTMVDQLIKPLGVSTSFRGFYHMTRPDMPRFTVSNGELTRVEPRTSTGAFNASYLTAPYEAAYVVHKSVMEAQVPDTTAGPAGAVISPQNYRGDWQWICNKDNSVNILGDKGYFLGQLACATKPVDVDNGFVILFQRTVTTPAA